MFIVQLPQTSSKQLESQTTGVVPRPSAFTGLRWMAIKQAITFALGKYGTLNSSNRPS
jgi:hypothetical protein